MRHRRPGPADADLQHPLARRLRQAPAEAGGEARPIRVVADPPPVPQQHGIHRPQRRGFGREVVQQRQHRLLAGMGDVQPAEAHPFGRQKQLRQRVRPQPQLGEVDPLIDQPPPLRGRLRLMHRRAERGGDAMADQAGQDGGAGEIGHWPHPPR